MKMPIKIQVKCPSCHESLMNDGRVVEELPSVHCQAKILDKVGQLFLSQNYGSYAKVFDGIDDIDGVIAELSCPQCHRALPMKRVCECGAPVLKMDLIIGGIIKFCSRIGCQAHSLEFENADDAFSLFKSQDESGLA